MNSKKFGEKLTAFRKKKNLTQFALAEKLCVSDKTVSKWERGVGYPEITQLPTLSNVLGISIDQLLSEEGNGIVVAGNMIADVVKSIDVYPKIGQLANLQNLNRAIGGCAPNVATDLAIIDPSLAISVIGKVGDDENGRFLTESIRKRGISVDNVSIIKELPTSFSDVMSLPTGERTFFSFRGANAELSYEDIPLETLDCKMFHIGYILFLDKLDAYNEEYGTEMARLLSDVQKRGIKTSFDVVSSSDVSAYKEKIVPALPYTDYAILNELECCNIWGISPRYENGELNVENLFCAMKKTLNCGVKEKVITHAKEGGFCLDKNGTFTKMGSLKIPEEYIKGSVGAGDAFCAGCLYGIYNGYTNEEMLAFATAAAACNLFAENSVDGMRNKKEIEKMMQSVDRRSL